MLDLCYQASLIQCSMQDLKLVITTLISDHLAQRAFLQHYAHNLVKRIGCRHRGMFGIGVISRLKQHVSDYSSTSDRFLCDVEAGTATNSQRPRQHPPR